jgi:N-acetylglucosaminyldiphosphoundecaprenol N-acetyl-beta-D-mannosaminyltransferase
VHVVVGGVPFRRVTRSGFVKDIVERVAKGYGCWVSTANLDIVRQVNQSGDLRESMKDVSDFVADGSPILWIASLLGKPLPERVCGSDLIYDLANAAASSRLPIYLLGGNPSTAQFASEKLTRLYPGLQVCGLDCPSIGFETRGSDIDEICKKVRDAQPAIVFVALGFPKQDLLIKRLRECWWQACYIGVGISFSFVSGEVKRAPRWMQMTGLEWCYRLSQEPTRLWRRYLIHDIPFLISMIGVSVLLRLANQPATPYREFAALTTESRHAN